MGTGRSTKRNSVNEDKKNTTGGGSLKSQLPKTDLQKQADNAPSKGNGGGSFLGKVTEAMSSADQKTDSKKTTRNTNKKTNTDEPKFVIGDREVSAKELKEAFDKLSAEHDEALNKINLLEEENKAVRFFNNDLRNLLDDSEKKHDNVLTKYNELNKLFQESKQKQDTAKNGEQQVEGSQTDAAESKADDSAKAEGTAAPEGETKTEQAQTTQEPAKEANARPGTGEATKDNIISPEDAFKFFNNKENYDKASTVFKTPSFDEYIDATTGKWIPRSYFDAFNAKDGIDPKKFTFEHFKAKIPEDAGKQLTSEEKTADIYNKNKAEEDYEKEYKNYNTGFKAYLRRHPKLEKILKTGKMAGGIGILYGIGQMFNDAYTAGQNDKDEVQNIINRLNDDDPEYLNGSIGSNNTNPGDIADKLKDADASTETPEGDSGTIEQAIAEQAPAGNVEPENPQVTANAATSTNTKANNAPASTAELEPTQGLPPVVTRNTPSTNSDSSGMTYSQRVEGMGQNPQTSGMMYKPTPSDLVTSQLIDAMGQAPQAGSDAIGYGDLYDQNFIDFWAKRNPNLAFGVSQGRK